MPLGSKREQKIEDTGIYGPREGRTRKTGFRQGRKHGGSLSWSLLPLVAWSLPLSVQLVQHALHFAEGVAVIGAGGATDAGFEALDRLGGTPMF